MKRGEDEPEREPGAGSEPRADGGPLEPDVTQGPSPKQVGAAVAAIVLLIFAFQNWDRVKVDFLFFSARSRTIVVIAIAAILGFVVGWFVGRPSRAERRRLRERD